MYSEREFSLALINFYYDQDVDVDVAIEGFAQKHPRRVFLADLLSTDWEIITES